MEPPVPPVAPDLKRLVRFAQDPLEPAPPPDIPRLIRSSVVAQMIGIKPETFRKWRKRGIGPTPLRFGRRVYYTEADVNEWMKKNRAAGFDPASDDH